MERIVRVALIPLFVLIWTTASMATNPLPMLLASADYSPVPSREAQICPHRERVNTERIRLAQRWEEEEKAKEVKGKSITGTMPDPFQPVNRGFFWVNDKLYFNALKPLARVYGFILPRDVRIGVRHVILNAHAPVRFANSLLQLKMKKAGIVLCRFVINTTIGLAGILDPASQMGLPRVDEDAGQTLGVYGLKEVAYIDWPLLGPSCVRDSLGTVADTLLDPIYYLVNGWVYAGLYAFNKLNETSLTLGNYESLVESAIDPYLAVRNAYYQYRIELIQK